MFGRDVGIMIALTRGSAGCRGLGRVRLRGCCDGRSKGPKGKATSVI